MCRGKGKPAPLIAVVDDDAFVDLMREVLTDEDYRVMVGTGEAGAAAMITRKQPDLTILDPSMHQASPGIHVLRTLRDDSSIAVLPCARLLSRPHLPARACR